MSTETPNTPGAEAAAQTAADPGLGGQGQAQTTDDDISTEAWDRAPDPDEAAESATATDSASDTVAGGEGADSVSGEAGQDTGDDTDAEDLIEFDAGDGQSYRIPKALQGHLLRQDDYTRKTQEVARERESLAAERTALSERQAAAEALLEQKAEVKMLEARVAGFDNIDWDTLEAEEPERAQRLWRQAEQTRRALEAAKTDLKAKTDERLEAQRKEAEDAAATRRKETGKVLAREIDGWGPEAAANAIEYGLERLGMTPEEFKAGPSVATWKAIDRAMKAEAKAAKLEAELKKAQTAGKHLGDQQVKPATTTTAAAPVVGVRDEVSTKEWMRRRNAQLASRAS